MNLDSVWLVYLNARVQIIEAAIAAGKTDAEIIENLAGDKALAHVEATIKSARTYVKVKGE